MKLYQIVISFLEPAQAVVTIGADTEEEAVRKIREEAEQQVQGLEIVSVVEIGEIQGSAQLGPQESTPEPAFQPLPDNVIQFPGNNTKH